MRKTFTALMFSALAIFSMPTMAVQEYSPDFVLHNLMMDTSMPGVLAASPEAQAEANLELTGLAVASLNMQRMSKTLGTAQAHNKLTTGNLLATALALDGRLHRTNL